MPHRKRVSKTQRGSKYIYDGKAVVGWSEYLDFIDWGVYNLPVKLDTGAKSSALHVEKLTFLSDGKVQFDIVLSRKKAELHRHVTAKISRWGRVRSTTGHYTQRCFVKTRMRMAGIEKEIEVSLVSREAMIYRMILGRTALEHDFIVDVSKRRLHGKTARKRSSGRKKGVRK